MGIDKRRKKAMKRLMSLILCLCVIFTMTFASFDIASASTYDFSNMQQSQWQLIFINDVDSIEFFTAGDYYVWKEEISVFDEVKNNRVYHVSKSMDDMEQNIYDVTFECCDSAIFCNDKYLLYLSESDAAEGFCLNVLDLKTGGNDYTFYETTGLTEIKSVYGGEIYLQMGLMPYSESYNGEIVTFNFYTSETKNVLYLGEKYDSKVSSSGRYLYGGTDKLTIYDAKQKKVVNSLSGVTGYSIKNSKLTYYKLKNGTATFYQSKMSGSSAKKIFSQKVSKKCELVVDKITSKYVYFMTLSSSGNLSYYRYSFTKKKVSKLKQLTYYSNV